VIFVIPYHKDFTMIGTTDISYREAPEKVKIATDEKIYLCEAVNRYFQKSISPDDIVNEWSGVRPLQSDDANNPSKVTRDYSLEIHSLNNKAPILSIFGGKITTYRKLAEHAMEKLKPYFPGIGKNWTANANLPGGNFTEGLNEFTKNLMRKYRWLPLHLAIRYAESYGTLTETLLENINSVKDLGEDIGFGLYEKEIEYLKKHEWATTTDDILWRRTKLGLWFTKEQRDRLNEFL
jgi:glycerol-3-phosphate dehydrogenase